MQKSPFQLTLAVSESEVFYHWNYVPPVPNLGGSLGVVWPDGTLHGMSFNFLQNLGNGKHLVTFDEKIRDSNEVLPIQSDDDRLFFAARFELFAESVDCCIAGEPLSTLILAFTPSNANRLIPLLSQHHRNKLTETAKSIAAKRNEGGQNRNLIYYSSGVSKPVPDANLKTIVSLFSTE